MVPNASPMDSGLPSDGKSCPSTETISHSHQRSGPFQPGEMVADRFRVHRQIAEGGMSFVYYVTDEKLNQPRALKVAKTGFAGLLSPEARSALRITHVNVCRVFEIHTARTAHGLVDLLSMEFVDGGTLSQRLKNAGPFSEPAARGLAAQICAGLAAAHAQNILHRDLKPNNVLLADDGGGGLRAVVTDFGLAQEPIGPPPSRLSGRRTAGPSGTPPYLAPERWEGRPASVASDIYALGIVLHELITGRRPPGKRGQQPLLNDNLPSRWRAVVARCVAADPAKRFASATEVAAALAPGGAYRFRTVAATGILLVALGLGSVPAPRTSSARLAILPLEVLGTEPRMSAVARGASYDLSSRLTRLRHRPRRFVVIPTEDVQDLLLADAATARERVGASHVLGTSLTPKGDRFSLRGAILDTTTQVALREILVEIDSAGAIAATLTAMVVDAFNLPRQATPENVGAEAYSQYAEGMAQLRGHQAAYPLAIAAFEKAIALDPRSPSPRARLAEAFHRAWEATGDAKWLDRGREELTRAALLDPDSVAVHLAAGKLNLVPGHYERAAREFRRATELDPSAAEAWHGLAASYEGIEGHGNDAAEAYLKTIHLQPDYFRPLTDFGNFHRRLGNYREAEKYWSRAVELAPRSATLRGNLGGLYADMGRWDDAERELKLALEMDAGLRSVLNNLGSLYQYRGRDPEAVSLFERARAAGPESYILALNLGDSYRRMGNARAAADAYRRGRKLAEQRLLANPRDAAVRAFVAYFALRLDEPAVAEKELIQALHFGEKDRTVIRRAAICFEAMGERSRALDVLRWATPDVLRELSRQPDLAALTQDPGFIAMLRAHEFLSVQKAESQSAQKEVSRGQD